MSSLKKIICVFGALFFILFAAEMSFASLAYPGIVKLKQPNGVVFEARAYGDEWANGMEAADGYTILREPATGYFVYALKAADGGLYPSQHIVGINQPPATQKHLRENSLPLEKRYAQSRKKRFGDQQIIGNLRVLVIVVEFTDRKLIGSNAADWKNFFFKATESVQHYYKEVTFNQFILTPAEETYGTVNDGIVQVQLDIVHPNTGGFTDTRNQDLTKRALTAADQYVDYSVYDLNQNGAVERTECLFAIVCAGYETTYGGVGGSKSPSVWSHSWEIWDTIVAPTLDNVLVCDGNSNGGYFQFGEWHATILDTMKATPDGAGGHMATIGPGGCFNAISTYGDVPKLWDGDGSARGIGDFCIMASGHWNGTENKPGDRPSHPCAWVKYLARWITRITISGKNKKVTIKQAENNKTGSIYLLGTNPGGPGYGEGATGEYFLIENRQLVGYDKTLPGAGLFIWHIEQSQEDNNHEGHTADAHLLVALEQADGLRELEGDKDNGDGGDPFPGTKNNRTFTKTTNPYSKWYSGADSKIQVTKISDSGKKMNATISTK
jgi:hypothetical protein